MLVGGNGAGQNQGPGLYSHSIIFPRCLFQYRYVSPRNIELMSNTQRFDSLMELVFTQSPRLKTSQGIATIDITSRGLHIGIAPGFIPYTLDTKP